MQYDIPIYYADQVTSSNQELARCLKEIKSGKRKAGVLQIPKLLKKEVENVVEAQAEDNRKRPVEDTKITIPKHPLIRKKGKNVIEESILPSSTGLRLD